MTGASAGTAAILAACGKGGTKTPAPPKAASQAGKPRAGGQINVAHSSEQSTYDPATKLSETGRVMLWTNDSVLSYKAGSGVPYSEMDIVPNLAERWEAPDGQTYTFHLHQGAKFANLPPINGRTLTSTDVEWSYEYLSRTGEFAGTKLPPSTAASMLAGLDRIETPDPSTVVLRFAQPYAPFLHYASSQWLPILAHEIFDADGDFSKRAVGTGPFQLDTAASQRGSHWVFKKNPTYFQAGLPYIDQINELLIKDQSADSAAFQSKQTDVLDYDGLTLDSVQQVKKGLPSAVEYSYLEPQGYFIYINVRRPPLSDVRVRQALALSLDRDQFIRSFANGKGEWALASSLPGLFTQNETKQILKHDPAKAKQLVTAAGYPNGVDIEFIYGTFYGPTMEGILQLLQAQVKNGGINVTLKPLDHATEGKRRRSGDFQLGITPRGQGLPLDLDSALYGVFYPKASENFDGVDDPQLTPLLVAQRQEMDPTKRQDLWKQAIRRVNEVPWALALFFGTAYNLWQPYVKDYAPNMSAVSAGMYLKQAWLEK